MISRSLNPDSPPFFPSSLVACHYYSSFCLPYEQPIAPPPFVPLLPQQHLPPCALVAAPWHCLWPDALLQPGGPTPEAFDLPVEPTGRTRRRRTLEGGMLTGKGACERTDAKLWYGNDGIVCYGRRRCQRKKPAVEKTVPDAFEFVAGDGCGRRTTVMIKNVPNKYTKDMLLAMIDEHCLVENEKVRSQMGGAGTAADAAFSEFDFFYLPLDFCTGHNLGYAFVNFTTADAAWRLHRAFHNKSWGLIPSPKICEITYARIQGLNALRANFENSRFVCNSVDVLPVQFSPPRDGCKFHKCCSKFIGTRVRRRTPPE